MRASTQPYDASHEGVPAPCAWRHRGVRPVASPRAILERLGGDHENLTIGVLDDLAYDLIRAYGFRPPRGFLEWISTTATPRIRKLCTSLKPPERSPGKDPALLADIRSMVAHWMRPQLEDRFGPLPILAHQVFDSYLSHGLGWGQSTF